MTDLYAEATAAFAAGYKAADERQSFYQARPGEGVRWPSDLDSWQTPFPTDRPKGLHYAEPPAPMPVYVADSPGLLPHVLPLPMVDVDVPVSLTGSSHGGWQSLIPAAGSAVVVDLRVPGTAAPQRRSLWSRLRGRRGA
jgi:hypothetical protein